MAPICHDVVNLVDKCMANQDKTHYIFIVDASGSVSSSNFNNALKTIESMIWFPLNGKNKVTIFEYGSTMQSRCNGITKSSQAKTCLFSKNKLGGGTATADAFDYALRFMRDPNFKNVVSIFTDGHSNTGLDSRMKNSVQAVRNKAKLLPFGIGSGVSKAELEYFANGNKNEVTYVKDYESFERLRYEYQTKMCAAI